MFKAFAILTFITVALFGSLLTVKAQETLSYLRLTDYHACEIEFGWNLPSVTVATILMVNTTNKVHDVVEFVAMPEYEGALVIPESYNAAGSAVFLTISSEVDPYVLSIYFDHCSPESDQSSENPLTTGNSDYAFCVIEQSEFYYWLDADVDGSRERVQAGWFLIEFNGEIPEIDQVFSGWLFSIDGEVHEVQIKRLPLPPGDPWNNYRCEMEIVRHPNT